MNDLIQRLTQTTQFHENADVTTKEVVDALEKQQAEIEQLADELNAMKDWKNSMRDKMEELKAQAAKDAADAGRYRWLASEKSETVTVAFDQDPDPDDTWTKVELDEAIDKAMKESQQ